jgi:MSHA biogenesis protein MshI
MAWFWKGKRLPGWISVNLLPKQIDIAHVRANGAGRPEVLLCDSYAAADGAAASLSHLRRSLQLDQGRCTTLLNASDYQMLQLEAPNVSAAEVKTAAIWRVKDMIDYPVERAAVDIIEIPGGAGAARGTSLLAFAAPDDKVRERVQVFEQAQIPLEAIDVPELAQRNIAALFETRGRALALVCFDSQGGLLTISSGGELLLSRNLDVTSTQLIDAATDRRGQLLERVGLELQRSLDHFDRQNTAMALSKLHVAALPEQVGLKEYLAANLSVPVEALDLDTVMDLSRVPELRNPLRQAQCIKVLGGALRGEMKAMRAA